MEEKTHVIPKFKHDFAMDPKAVPALTVDSPCRIRFETDDTAYLRASKGESADDIGWHKFNAITGPAYITGAEPGMMRKDFVRIKCMCSILSKSGASNLDEF